MNKLKISIIISIALILSLGVNVSASGIGEDLETAVLFYNQGSCDYINLETVTPKLICRYYDNKINVSIRNISTFTKVNNTSSSKYSYETDRYVKLSLYTKSNIQSYQISDMLKTLECYYQYGKIQVYLNGKFYTTKYLFDDTLTPSDSYLMISIGEMYGYDKTYSITKDDGKYLTVQLSDGTVIYIEKLTGYICDYINNTYYIMQ